MVALEKIAHHATYYNPRSIGIEMAGYAGDPQTWTDSNVAALRKLVVCLASKYHIPLNHPPGDAQTFPKLHYDLPGLVAHSQVQPITVPNEYKVKSDPGPHFPWESFLESVQADWKMASVVLASPQAGFATGFAVSDSTKLGAAAMEALPIELSVTVDSERIIRVETSTDSQNWEVQETFVAQEGTSVFERLIGTESQRFYRFSWGPN